MSKDNALFETRGQYLKLQSVILKIESWIRCGKNVCSKNRFIEFLQVEYEQQQNQSNFHLRLCLCSTFTRIALNYVTSMTFCKSFAKSLISVRGNFSSFLFTAFFRSSQICTCIRIERHPSLEHGKFTYKVINPF